MRYGRHIRHLRHNRHERHGTKAREFLNGELTTSVPSAVAAQLGDPIVIQSTVEGGVGPFTYVWKKGATVIANQTSDKLAIASAVAGDAGNYTVTVTDQTGDSVTSEVCSVTVNSAP